MKCSITPDDRASTAHFPRKLSSTSAMGLFPPECIFCEKLELKSCGKTERCVKFPVFKDKDRALKEPTWKQIEPRQERITRSLHPDYILESTFACIFLFLEPSQVLISSKIGLCSLASALETKEKKWQRKQKEADSLFK